MKALTAAGIVLLSYVAVDGAITMYMGMGAKIIGIDQSFDNYAKAKSKGYVVGLGERVYITNNKNCSLVTGTIWVEQTHVQNKINWMVLEKYIEYTRGKNYIYHVPLDEIKCSMHIRKLIPLAAEMPDHLSRGLYGSNGKGYEGPYNFTASKLYQSFRIYIDEQPEKINTTDVTISVMK